MVANSNFFLSHIALSQRLALSFFGIGLILLTITVNPARGQVTQDEWRSPAFLDSLQHHTFVGQTNIAFIQFFGASDIDDPLDDFLAYVIDPVNWDPAAPIERRTVYRAHIGFETRQNIFNGTSSLSIGFETQMAQTRVYPHASSGRDLAISHGHQNLIDIAYAPSLSFKSQLLPWLGMIGNLRMDILTFDVQDVCPTTCSSEPQGHGTERIPSYRGGLFLGPWVNTQVFINFGKGFYRFEDREPVGSTAEQQINRTKFLEIGFLSNPGGQMEIRGSLWGTKNDSDFVYNMEDETFLKQGSSQRYGINLETRMQLLSHTTLSGGFTVSRSTFRQTQHPISLTPRLVGHADLHNDWNSNWGTTLQWQYIGTRTTGNQSLPAFQTLDVLFHYHLPMAGDTGAITASLGIINMFNHKSPYSLSNFDSGFTPDHIPAIDVQYFPDQPRTVVSGISWLF